MKTYIGSFLGIWLGGYIVARAESEDDARNYMLVELAKHDPKWCKSLEIDMVIPDWTVGAQMIWNGDY